MKIIPAIDIIDGKAVRLSQGDFSRKKIYYEDPLDIAKQFEDAGIQRLHLVDLEGAKAGEIRNLHLLQRIADATVLIIDFGGGIKNEKGLIDVFNAGAAMATIGSLAVKQPVILKEWIDKYGADRFYVGADVSDKHIKINGWMENAAIDIFFFLQSMIAIGVKQFFCTDIQKDGIMNGPSVDLYKEIFSRFPGIQLTASGGVTSLHDLTVLKSIGCDGAIIGKAIYENVLSLEQLRKWESETFLL